MIPATSVPAARSGQFGEALADALAVTWRNLRAMSRVPQVIVFATVQPIIFVLTFRYVFGNAIRVPGDYVDFLIPGVFVQTVAFGAMGTGIGLAEDLQRGMIERFKSLPMARSAVLAGRTLADLARNVAVLALMVAVGFLVGFDYHAGLGAFLAAFGVLLAFSFAFSWLFATIGLAAPNGEAAQAMSFPILAILVFASSAFVPADTMPGWLQAYNDVQPVSVTVEAVRALSLGGPAAGKVAGALGWATAIVAAFAPLAVARYRRAA